MSKNNKNTKVFLAEIQAIIRAPLTLTVNIKPDWTLGVDDAKAKSTTTPPEASADTCNKIASTFERDGMRAEDVGLSRNLQFFKTRGIVEVTSKVACTTIYQPEKFSLCIFFLPANAVLPLHNHPGMTVFSKLLLGKVHAY
ncbi:hypothetical protein QVD17_32661 [Tagetes erecta]|uniref:cysteine dioxygenase n=1 Tax=Tagetes erecta TaxID=13708 RepID=A0AAD8NKW4_TARER|nr:hypothetical protein QVD17_32661 [Tagetes erecta]